MALEGSGSLLRIFIGEGDRWHGRPLYQALVEELRKRGTAGATVLRGIEGFGAHSRLHTTRILRLSADLPIVVEVIDTDEKIDALIPLIDEMVNDGMVTREKVTILSYRGKGKAVPREDGEDQE